jgi:hypothetical protein
VSRESLNRTGLFDESMDGDMPAAADIAFGLQMYSRGINLVYGRAAIGFHQRNHALSMAEDPEYFERRRSSVWKQESRVHNQWLSGQERERIMTHIADKRALNCVIADTGAKFTLQVEKGDLGRLTTIPPGSPSPDLSVFLMSDGDELALSQILLTLAQQDCSNHDFEVLVLDPAADVDEMTDDYSAAAHIAVQATRVPYTLRYFPTGTMQHRTAVENIRQHYLSSGGLAAEAGDRLLTLQEQTYTRHIQRLLLEKPLAEISVTLKSSGPGIGPDFLSTVLTALRQAQGREKPSAGTHENAVA